MVRSMALVALCAVLVVPSRNSHAEELERYKSQLSNNDMSVILVQKSGKVYGCSITEHVEGAKITVTKTTEQDAAIEVENIDTKAHNIHGVRVKGFDKDIFSVVKGSTLNAYFDK